MSINNTSEPLFDDLVGHLFPIKLMEAAIKKVKIAPAYIFSGPEGVGKSLAALRFLEGVITGGPPVLRERKRLEARNHPDLFWVEPTYQYQGRLITQAEADSQGLSRPIAPQIRLDQIRGVTNFLGREPLEAKKGMVVIENVESIAEGASNALLKTLEEPGKGLILLLTRSPEKLLPTIRSRCQEIYFGPLKFEEMELVIRKNSSVDFKEVFEDFDQEELLGLACGSPGAFLKHISFWKSFPQNILGKVSKLPSKPIDALALARDITEGLTSEQQLWLIEWLQVHLWRNQSKKIPLKRLEKLRKNLEGFVQPRLAWEVALLELMNV